MSHESAFRPVQFPFFTYVNISCPSDLRQLLKFVIVLDPILSRLQRLVPMTAKNTNDIVELIVNRLLEA